MDMRIARMSRPNDVIVKLMERMAHVARSLNSVDLPLAPKGAEIKKGFRCLSDPRRKRLGYVKFASQTPGLLKTRHVQPMLSLCSPGIYAWENERAVSRFLRSPFRGGNLIAAPKGANSKNGFRCLSDPRRKRLGYLKASTFISAPRFFAQPKIRPA